MKNIRFIFVGALLLLLATGSAWAAKPRVQYDHKKMNIHLNLSMRAFTLYERMMPDDLRQEIGGDYYPYLREHLSPGQTLQYKKATAGMTSGEEGRMTISLDFPKFTLVFRDVTWEEMDGLFRTYFTENL